MTDQEKAKLNLFAARVMGLEFLVDHNGVLWTTLLPGMDRSKYSSAYAYVFDPVIDLNQTFDVVGAAIRLPKMKGRRVHLILADEGELPQEAVVESVEGEIWLDGFDDFKDLPRAILTALRKAMEDKTHD